MDSRLRGNDVTFRRVEELKGQFKRLGWMATACHSSTLDLRLLDLNSTEQSENVYENKEPARKINHPWPLLVQGGEFRAPRLG